MPIYQVETIKGRDQEGLSYVEAESAAAAIRLCAQLDWPIEQESEAFASASEPDTGPNWEHSIIAEQLTCDCGCTEDQDGGSCVCCGEPVREPTLRLPI